MNDIRTLTTDCYLLVSSTMPELLLLILTYIPGPWSDQCYLLVRFIIRSMMSELLVLTVNTCEDHG